MRSASFSLLLLAFAAFASTGCGVPVPAYRYGVRYEVLIPTSSLPRCSEEHPTGCSIDGHDDAPGDAPAEAYEASGSAPDPEPGRIAPYRSPPTLRPFDLQQARSTLSRVDMSSCRSHGLGRGYLHARVTFAPSGRVEGALIDAAPGGRDAVSDDARACVSNLLASVTVPSFAGDVGSITTEWFLP